MKYLRNQEFLVILLIASGLVIVASGIYLNWWQMNTVLDLVPEIILFSFIPLFLWGFRKRIWGESNNSMTQSSVTNTRRMEANLAVFMGSPDFVDPKYIWHYHTRDRINFPVFLRQAKKKIRMSALTFSLLTLQYEPLLRELASNGIKLTFLILDPLSEEAKRQTSLYRSSNDLTDQINSSLKRLCELKQRYPKNITIKKYALLHGDSITILDDSTIKVEEHVIDSGPNDRENLVIFKKDSKKDFSSYLKQFNGLEKSATEHQCQPS